MILAAAAMRGAGAQHPVDTSSSGDTTGIRCDGRIVTTVDISPKRPPFSGNLARWRKVARALGLHHATTRATIIRRFVTLAPGHPCSEFRRAESERILRAQPYLASARVRTVADGPRGARVEVETVDDAPVLVGGALRQGQLAEVSVGNQNAFGRAMLLDAFVQKGFAYRDGFGGTFTHYQLFGRPYTITLDGEQRPQGDNWRAEAGHAFLTDLQRVAWHAGALGQHDYMPLSRVAENDDQVTLPVAIGRFDVGGVLRFGPPGGRLGLVGGVLAGENVIPAEKPVVITDSGFLALPGFVPLPYVPYRAMRLNVVSGIRTLRFRPAVGFDALTAKQDIARGVQLGLILGRGFDALGSDGDDVLLSTDLFVGAGSPWSYLGIRVEGEARRPLGINSWDGILGSGRAAWYIKESPKWTLILDAEGAGAWNPRLPVGLTLADRDGLRGMPRRGSPIGPQRFILRAEQRWAVGAIKWGDVGVAAFTDAGRLWRPDSVPLPLPTVNAQTVGISLLGAVPKGSPRLWRMDVAMPVYGAPGKVQVFLGSSVRTRTFWREPDKIRRARSSSGLQEIFSWP